MSRCEDYPCCGHTDGLGCDYTPDYTYIGAHAGCDHEAGDCYMDAYEYDVCPWCDERVDDDPHALWRYIQPHDSSGDYYHPACWVLQVDRLRSNVLCGCDCHAPMTVGYWDNAPHAEWSCECRREAVA